MDITLKPKYDNDVDDLVYSASSEAVFSLPKNELVRLESGRDGLTIAVDTGIVWVTQEGDLVDHVLTSGQVMSVSQRGTVILQSMKEAVTRVSFSKN